ncbi:MAG: ferrous iron transport protein A [Clostridiales bacterium]|jgi:Fe2+ transport system protein FeoA|nr:ferrous iron transport protein A [Clostridiales bacterium]
MEKRLSQMTPQESGTVVRVEAEGQIKRRLYDMGVTAGASVRYIKTAPLGDPLQVVLRGYSLSLRKTEAQNVFVEVAGL